MRWGTYFEEVQVMRTFGVSQATGRRSVPRAEAPSPAVLSLPAGDYHTAIEDVSRTGVRLRGSVLPLVGQRVLFRAANLQMSGDVVWRDVSRCAVEFDSPIAVDEVQRIRFAA